MCIISPSKLRLHAFMRSLLQVWQSNLSENEREYLMQFLPKGSDAEEVVQTLLAGDNFHFGNPFVKWQVFLCNAALLKE